MANRQHRAILTKGVDAWNQWRLANPEIVPDLSNAPLRYARLNKIDLHNAKLANTDFYAAELRNADLRNADLHMAHLYRTDFCDADLSGATIRGADMVKAKLINAQLQGTDLRWVKLGDANLRGANLTASAVYAISAWDVILDGTIQLNLSITRDGTPTVTVDRLEVAQFIHMLLNYKKIRDVLNSVMNKGVLILGSFKNGGIDLLQAIAARLRKDGYLPMIFDFERPDTADYIETVRALASLSKFVIVELSGPSVPQELEATIPYFQIPFVPIIDNKHEIHSTFVTFLTKYKEWVLFPIRFSTRDELFTKFSSEIITPALARIRKLQAENKVIQKKFEDFNHIFPYDAKGEKLMEVTEDNMNALPFQKFRKSALLHARILTEEDHKQKNGTIQTLEGSTTFQPGDYLAVGVQNEEWPISQQHFLKTYKRLSPPDKDGFAPYRTTEVREAYQMPDAFTVQRTNGDTLTGEAGDYLVRTKEKVWITKRDIFERSYELC